MAKKREFKEAIFLKEYLKHQNGTKAAKAAGYKDPANVACKLLKKPYIIADIKEHRAKIMEKYKIDEERVLKEWAKMAFSNLGDFLSYTEEGEIVYKNSEELTEDQFAQIQEVSNSKKFHDGDLVGTDVRLKLHDKQKALEALSRHLGLFNDKMKVEVKTIDVNLDPEDLGE